MITNSCDSIFSNHFSSDLIAWSITSKNYVLFNGLLVAITAEKVAVTTTSKNNRTIYGMKKYCKFSKISKQSEPFQNRGLQGPERLSLFSLSTLVLLQLLYYYNTLLLHIIIITDLFKHLNVSLHQWSILNPIIIVLYIDK